MPRVRVLFTSTLFTSFIQEDLRLLRGSFEVDFLRSSGLSALLQIFVHVPRCNVTYTWFGSVYAFVVILLAKLFGKESILVIGGADASKIPEFRYGIWLSPWKAPLVGWAMRHAHRVLAVDPALKAEAAKLAGYPGENIEYVPTGYDASLWVPAGAKQPFVLTVAACDDLWKMKVKGVDVLLEAAKLCPEIRFMVVGMGAGLIEEVGKTVPPNIVLKPFLEQRELLGYYQRASVYCQPSRTEGLPNSLCEAMLCECVPVGSDRGGIPTAIAGNGIVVPYGDPGALADGLRRAFQSPADSGKRARAFIARTFTLERRETSLRRIIQEAVHLSPYPN